MGAVYKAHDRELGRTVAIKVIRPEMASRPEVLDRFKREILLASRVTHKNVVRIHDLGEADGVRFISMSYVEGSSLTALLQEEGPLAVERALPLVRQIGEALQAAHDAGIVHRDLKPQNILIDREGNAYIADFGISRSIEAGGTMTETGVLLGTVDYMSPEQARGEKSDQRGDLYSFGVILFEIFTGTLPFSGGDALSVMMKRIHEEPPPIRQVRPEVPVFISEIVSRALRRDPKDRYPSVAELLGDLDRRQASVSWRRIRRRALVPAATGLVLAAALAAGALYLKTRRPPAPITPRTSLVILPFQNDTGDPRYDWARAGLPSLLRDDLMQARDLRLVGEERVQDVLQALRIPEGEASRPATVRKIATLVGADHVLAGRLLKIGDRLRVEATLASSGFQETPGSSLSVDGAGEEAIQSMLAGLTHRIREELGVSPGWLERARGATEPSTRSAEALALYGEGLALSRTGNHLDASKRLESAVQKDPGFSVARALLAETYETLGYSDKAAAEADRAAAALGSSSPYEAARIRATLNRLRGDLESAEEAYASLCEITPSDAEAFFSLASVRQDRGNLQGALESLRRVVALDPRHPKAHFAMGKLLFQLGNPTEAFQELDVAVGLYNETGNDEGKARVLNGLGNLYLDRGQYSEALARFQGALEIRRRIGDEKGVYISLGNIALTYQRLGRHAEAITTQQEALTIVRHIGDRTGLGNAYSGLGDLYLVAGQPQEAMQASQESLKIFRERGVQDPAGEARALANMGTANTVLGRYVEGLYALEDALAKRREIGDKSEIILSLSDIGDNERFQGGYEDALKYYTEGLSLARETESQPKLILFLWSLSNVHEDQGEFGAALSILTEAEKLSIENEQNTLLAASLLSLGNVRRRLGDFRAAETALDDALRWTRATNDAAMLTEALCSEAALHLARGERDRAVTTSREALRMAESLRNHRLLLLARLQAGEIVGSTRELEVVLREAESAGLLPIVGAAHLALARLHQADNPREAVREADLALATATNLGQRDLLFQAYGLAGKSLKQLGDLSGAASRFSAALDPLEEMCRGLADAPLRSFLGRIETAAFREDAQSVFLAVKREGDLERLRSLIPP